jgi:hypothetical protein
MGIDVFTHFFVRFPLYLPVVSVSYLARFTPSRFATQKPIPGPIQVYFQPKTLTVMYGLKRIVFSLSLLLNRLVLSCSVKSTRFRQIYSVPLILITTTRGIPSVEKGCLYDNKRSDSF